MGPSVTAMGLDESTVEAAYFEELPGYLAEWERSAIEELPGKFVEGTVDVTDVLQVYLWKNYGLNLGAYNAFRLLDADLDTLQRTVDDALSAPTVTERVDRLTDLEFVAVPAASAILTFSAPETYAVYDANVIAALADRWPERARELEESGPAPADYERFLAVCRDLREELDVSLRTLDRALWLHGNDEAAYVLAPKVGEGN
jgi:hypothetical protein